jgi:hypothetical protein
MKTNRPAPAGTFPEHELLPPEHFRNINRLACSFFFAVALLATTARADELRVPSFTAYLEPREGKAHVTKTGINNWSGSTQKVAWHGLFRTNGALNCAVALRPTNLAARLRLTVAGQSRDATANNGVANFGAFHIAAPGYQRFALELLDANTVALDALTLTGAATANAHFNLKPRRNAASVHLSYPVPKGGKVNAFYCEVTAVKDPLPSYYMACGWHRGYFGMQVNGPTERRIIFSVWDSGGEAVDRKKVADENRTKLVAKGEGVVSGDFGNEGTGGHSHLVYPWKTGETQRFIVTAKSPDATHTIYSGFWFHPEKKSWMLISSWKAPKDGGLLRGLYSFNEDFGGTGNFQRKALFGNQWFRTANGQWQEITTAGFSHDGTGKEDRLDRFMGVEDGKFFLSNGGFVPGFTKYGEKFTRPATGKPPTDLNLPALPE